MKGIENKDEYDSIRMMTIRKKIMMRLEMRKRMKTRPRMRIMNVMIRIKM